MQKINNFLINSKAEPVLKDEEFEQMKCDDFNNMKGNLNETDGIDCPECKNKGYISEVVYMEMYKRYENVFKPCHCMPQRKLSKLAISSGLGEYLKKRSDDYIVTEQWQQSCKSMMINYCMTIKEQDNWFCALGTSGSGKTLLCSIIANHLLNNMKQQVLYITWTDFISKLKRDMMGDKTNNVSSYLDELKNCEVLFIDELLKKYTETDLKYIVEIINYRYTNDLRTIITSERLIGELLDIDEATFSRVVEKCNIYMINIPKDRNKNYRLKGLKI